VTEFLDGTSDSRIAALFSAEWDWDIAQNLKLTQAASAVADTGGSATIIVDSSNTTLNLLTGLNAQLSDRLTARLSYNVDYDSNPPAGTENTDTLSRMTLIYDF
jgi:putative salt-induced outer membrane protein